MKRALHLAALCCFGFGCAARQTVYRAPDLDLNVIREKYVVTQLAVHLVFYIRKDEIHEVDGVIKSATEKDGIEFEYFNSETHQLMQAAIPMQNIYEISSLETNYEKNKTIGAVLLAGFALFFLVYISVN